MILTALAWHTLTFTAPADTMPGIDSLFSIPVTRYVATLAPRLAAPAPESTITLYSRQDTTALLVIPKPPGQRERLYIRIPADSKGRIARIYSYDAAGNMSGPSNPVVAIKAGGTPWQLGIAAVAALAGLWAIIRRKRDAVQ